MAVVSSRNLSFGGGLSIGNPVFTPAALFSAGEQGVWYDPSDFSTLYQDTSGTTPVTAVEQPVGLMLDKSQGLTLGPELVTNGDFSLWTADDPDWWVLFQAETATGYVTENNGGARIVCVGAGTANGVTKAFLSTGKVYRVSFDVTEYVSGALKFGSNIAANDGKTGIAAVGSYSFTHRASSNGLKFLRDTPDTDITIDNISVKEIAGNHAVAANNGTARPILRARYNQLVYSEQFDNAAWSNAGLLAFGSGSTANATTAPDGTTTADLITENTASGGHYVYQQISVVSGANYTATAYIKANGRTKVRFNLQMTALVFAVRFDLTAVTATTTSGSGTASITDAGNGWYRCAITATATSTSSAGYFGIDLVNDANTTNYTGDGTSGIYIWGAQLVADSVFPSNVYQRIAAATDYATGADFPPYLAFTTDDAMSTASIDFSGTDEMSVFAGVTKQSDAATAFVCELSAAVATNAGSFYLGAPTGNGAQSYRYGTKGTAAAEAGAGIFAAAPDAAVITGLSDISGDTATLRRNGVVVQTVTTDQGTGNYGNYPLYIGARNNSLLFFNGSLYSLIVRGKTTLPSEITATEAWVADKTGVTL